MDNKKEIPYPIGTLVRFMQELDRDGYVTGTTGISNNMRVIRTFNSEVYFTHIDFLVPIPLDNKQD